MAKVAAKHHRLERVADAIHRELARILQFKAKDPRLKFITISEVNVAKGMQFARVYFTVLGEEAEVDAAKKLLAHMSGFLRSSLAQAMQLRIVPELAFIYDETAQRAAKISHLIDSACTELG